MADSKDPNKEGQDQSTSRTWEQYQKEDRGKAKDDFNNKSANTQQADKADTTKSHDRSERSGSEQVRNTSPAPQPKPPGNVRGAVDRTAHNERMAKDDKAARDKNAELQRAKELKADIQKSGHDKTKDDRDKGK